MRVSDLSVDSVRAELALLAARFVLPGLGPDVNRAIRVACDLLARDLDTPATVAVGALAFGTSLRDAGPVIRDMLREQGFPAAAPDVGEPGAFATVLRAVAAGGMPTSEFFSFFLRVVPAWEQQEELQRRLVVLLNEWSQEATPQERLALEAAVRSVARDAVAGAS